MSCIKHLYTLLNILLILGILNIVLGIINLILAFITMLPLNFAVAGLSALVGLGCLFGTWKLNDKKKLLKKDEGITE